MDKSIMKRVVMQKSIHHEERVLCLRFERGTEIEKVVKKLPACRWSQTMKCWYLPNTTLHFRKALQELRKVAYVDFSEVVNKPTEAHHEKPPIPVIVSKDLPEPEQPVHQEIEKFTSWLKSKRYSGNTIKTYTEALKTFLNHYATKSSSVITNNDVIRFNNDYILKNNYSSSFQNQVGSSKKNVGQHLQL